MNAPEGFVWVGAGESRLKDKDGIIWLVVSKVARITPYKRAGQDTKIEGYTYGLIRLGAV